MGILHLEYLLLSGWGEAFKMGIWQMLGWLEGPRV